MRIFKNILKILIFKTILYIFVSIGCWVPGCFDCVLWCSLVLYILSSTLTQTASEDIKVGVQTQSITLRQGTQSKSEQPRIPKVQRAVET